MREVTERIDGNKEEKRRWRRDWVKGRERGVRKKEGEIWWGGVEGGAVGRATQTNEENEEVELSNTIHLLFVTSGRCTCELQDYFCKSTAVQLTRLAAACEKNLA